MAERCLPHVEALAERLGSTLILVRAILPTAQVAALLGLALTSFDTGGMTAAPYSFGPAQQHNPNRGGKIVKIENGKWIVATPNWTTLPPGS